MYKQINKKFKIQTCMCIYDLLFGGNIKLQLCSIMCKL